MLALQREAAWAEERLLSHLRLSVPQNGRVHLHILEKGENSKKIGIRGSGNSDKQVMGGANFLHPPPKNTLLGVGGV